MLEDSDLQQNSLDVMKMSNSWDEKIFTIRFLAWSVAFSKWIELPTSMSHGRDADGQCDPSANLTSSTVLFKTPA